MDANPQNSPSRFTITAVLAIVLLLWLNMEVHYLSTGPKMLSTLAISASLLWLEKGSSHWQISGHTPTHLHQPPRLHDEGILQPVDLSDGRLPQLPHESSGPLSHRVWGPGGGDHLHHGDVVNSLNGLLTHVPTRLILVPDTGAYWVGHNALC
jgi:hypothetical protein